MPIHAVCPECRAAYDLVDEQRGKKVRCKKCDNVFVAGAAAKPQRGDVPEAEAVSERSARAAPKKPLPVPARRPSARDDEEDDRDARRRPAPAKKGGGFGLVFLIGGLAILGLVVIVGGVGLILALRWFGKDDAKVSNPHMVGGWNPGDRDDAADNAKPIKNPVDNQPAEQDPPEDNKAVREPVVKDAPADENAKPVPGAPGQLALDVLRKVKRATALIRVTMADGGRASGTGFFAIEPNVLLTNAHVLGMLRSETPPKSIEVVLDSGEMNEQRFNARIRGVDRDADLAVLKVILRDDQKEGTIPKPLEVKSGADLTETQELYVFGFPLGEALGKEITVRKSSVASLRKDEFHRLDKVQVHGGMDPGNSGGPVVDSSGDVVGVAVSGIVGTQINFAIPGERVRSLLQGRIKEMGINQPYQQDSKVVMAVTINLLDPLNRINEVALDVWTGDEGKLRPPAIGDEPKPLPGDSPRQRTKLPHEPHKETRKGDAITTAKGEIALPPLPPGKVYYVQPFWVNAAGVKQWASGDPKDLRPVDRKPARLVLQQQKGDRTLNLTTEETRALRAEGGKGVDQKIAVNAQMQEKTTEVNKTGATMALLYTKVALSETRNGQQPPDEEANRLKNLASYMSKVASGLEQDPKGNLQQSPAIVQQGVPQASQQQVRALNIEIMQVLQAMAVPLPDGEVKYGARWTASRTIPSARDGASAGSVVMTYTYFGTRKNAAGREEAVIGVEGKTQGIDPRAPDNGGGKATGEALIDLTTGQLTQADLTFSTDTAVTEELKIAETFKARLKRSVR